MKVLFSHNHYQLLGGEDISFASESALLKKNGHIVISYIRDNKEINALTTSIKVRLFTETIWSTKTYHEIRKLISSEKPDLVHVQNFFPLISPSIFAACRDAGVPVVMSVRNYRLICPSANFTRNERPCEDCLGKFISYPGILHKCYRNSRTQTAAVVAMQSFHRLLGTWETSVNKFIALSEFTKNKLIQGGVSPLKIEVKPNFVEDPGMGDFIGEYAIFVGRLSPEKGLSTLLKTWGRLPEIPLLIVGDGPMRDEVKKFCANYSNIHLLGQQQHHQVLEFIKKARFLVFPTEWYETFGRVAIEAYACSIPVIASRIGAVEELIKDQETGLLFTPRDDVDLEEKVRRLWNHPQECQRMGQQSRIDYEKFYSPDVNYQKLLNIYEQTVHSYTQKFTFGNQI